MGCKNAALAAAPAITRSKVKLKFKAMPEFVATHEYLEQMNNLRNYKDTKIGWLNEDVLNKIVNMKASWS
jgi:hypothetical protein